MNLSATLFDHLMQPFAGPSLRFAIALSGGPDSMAMALLLHEWVKKHNGTLHAFTVDHALRDDSAAEARQVGEWLKPYAIPHQILTWQHEAVTSAIHAEARKARYDLLLDACRAHTITHLFLAHHADDQAETVLMRFARGSGPDGLAGMPLMREEDGIMLCRPLLPVRKKALIDYCQARRQPFVTDPSNAAPRYARARLREAQESLAKEGMTVERLYDMARLNGIQRNHMEIEANQWLEAHGEADAYGVVRLDAAAWQNQSEALRCRILVRGLFAAGNDDYAPRGAALDRLNDRLANSTPENFPGKTLSGCVIARDEKHITLAREESGVDETWPTRLWDKRFVLTSTLAPDVVIKKLGPISRDRLEKNGFPDIAAQPARTRATLPALFRGGELFDIPVFAKTASRQSHIHAQFSPYRSLIVKAFYPCPPFVG